MRFDAKLSSSFKLKFQPTQQSLFTLTNTFSVFLNRTQKFSPVNKGRIFKKAYVHHFKGYKPFGFQLLLKAGCLIFYKNILELQVKIFQIKSYFYFLA